MTEDQILSLGPQLADFLDEFADCFGRPEPRQKLGEYVRGQCSDMPRKNVESIARYLDIVPRTLQEFLRSDAWDHERLRDRTQQIIVRDHADPQALGIIDDSGHPKTGDKTAGVARQYCGRTGKVDNCVVTVHLSFASFDTHFRAMLDSTLYLPEHGWDDPQCRQEAGIPDELGYRPKYVIALEQLDRARANGVAFGWITADEWYAQKPDFLAGLEARGHRYVVEIPKNTFGWLFCPGGPQTRYVAKPVFSLCRFSEYMNRRPWQRFHIKDTDKGPQVWEVKAAPFWRQRDSQILGPYWLIWTRNAEQHHQQKYLLSNAAPGVPLEVLLHVAFARWPIERCLEDEKSRLGLSDFEVRNYQSLCRHLYVTQLTHLFVARQTQRLRGEKSGHHFVPSPRRHQCLDPSAAAHLAA